MYRFFLLFIPAILFTLLLKAQDEPKVQWASDVIRFSSEYQVRNQPGNYAAEQALGPPSVLPEYGVTPCAWAPGKENREVDEFIEVAFAEPMQVAQVVICQSLNPGAIYEIYLIDEADRKYKVFQQVPKATGKDKGGEVLRHDFPLTAYKAKGLYLSLITQNVPGFNMIDAIGISDSRQPVPVEINLIEGAEEVDEPENLTATVNSRSSELAPQISSDGRTLFFTRQGHLGNIGSPNTQDIWYAEWNDSLQRFDPAKNIGAPVNNAKSNAICATTPNGQAIVVLGKYKPDGSIESGVSISFKKGENGWTFPSPLNIEDFYNNNRFGEYYLADDGKTFIFAIERNDSEGGKDLYVSFKGKGGVFSAPKSLGPILNTADDEISPYLASDGRTLFFATSGFPGYGGADMFVSRRLDDSWTNWSEPKNLGPKLNGPAFDAYYSVSANGEYAYFTSTKNSIGESDIFRVKLPQAAKPAPVVLIYGKVLNAKTEAPLGARITYESLASGQPVGLTQSNLKTGEYSIILPAGEAYGFLAQQKGYMAVSENIDAKKIEEYKEIEVDLYLTPIEKGAKIRLNNLFFDSNKFNIKEEDKPELNRVVEFLNDYPNIQIEISGHTDNIGSDAANLALSNNRAKAVVDYLKAQGIEGRRLSAKGYGEAQPVGDNGTDKGRAQNRRIEMKIVKIEE